MAVTWEQISEACPRARWKRDIDVDYCEQTGCQVRFGRFGLPGISWSSSSVNSITTTATTPSSTTSSSPFSRTTSASSTDSLSLQTSVDEGTDTATSRGDFFLPTSTFFASTLTTLSPKSSVFSSSLDSFSINSDQRCHPPRSSTKLALSLHRRHHCRRCGSCFCCRHSSNYATLSLASEDIPGVDVQYNSLDTINEGSSTAEAGPESEVDLPPRPFPSPSKRYIQARVCNGCYLLCQRARARRSSSSIDVWANDSSWSTPTTQQDEDEYILSKERIRREQKRERREALKLMCHVPLANRVIAKAGSRREEGSRLDKVNGVESSLLRQADYSTDLGLGRQMTTATVWEKAQRKRRTEELARKAQSLDSLYLGRSNTETDDDDDAEWELDLASVLTLSNTSIFDRRCASRPPSPQPMPTISRRGSEGATYPSDAPLSHTFRPLSPRLTTTSTGMGVTRLQRCFDSHQFRPYPLIPSSPPPITMAMRPIMVPPPSTNSIATYSTTVQFSF